MDLDSALAPRAAQSPHVREHHGHRRALWTPLSFLPGRVSVISIARGSCAHLVSAGTDSCSVVSQEKKTCDEDAYLLRVSDEQVCPVVGSYGRYVCPIANSPSYRRLYSYGEAQETERPSGQWR